MNLHSTLYLDQILLFSFQWVFSLGFGGYFWVGGIKSVHTHTLVDASAEQE